MDMDGRRRGGLRGSLETGRCSEPEEGATGSDRGEEIEAAGNDAPEKERMPSGDAERRYMRRRSRTRAPFHPRLHGFCLRPSSV